MDFPAREDLARKYAEAINDDALEQADVSVLAKQVSDMHVAQPVTILADQISHTVRWDRTGFAEIPESRMIHVTLAVPCTGAAGTLHLYAKPGAAPAGEIHPNNAGIWLIKLGFDLKRTESLTKEALDANIIGLRNQWLSALQEAAEKANLAIEDHRLRLLNQVTKILDDKHYLLTMVRSSMQTAGISLKPSPESVLQVQMRPKALTLKQVDKSAANGVPEYELAEAIALSLLDTIRSFTNALARLPETANTLLDANEQSMRDILLFILNANWEGSATGETFIGLGKTDILLRWKDRDAFTGECKIWSSEDDLSSAINQLLGRYMVWHNTRAALIVFIRNRKDITAVTNKAKNAIENHDNFLGLVKNERFPDDNDYEMRSFLDPNRSLKLSLITVPLPDMRAELVK
ncbi:hypothetical protein [Arthrobacter sp. TMS2-4]